VIRHICPYTCIFVCICVRICKCVEVCMYSCMHQKWHASHCQDDCWVLGYIHEYTCVLFVCVSIYGCLRVYMYVCKCHKCHKCTRRVRKTGVGGFGQIYIWIITKFKKLVQFFIFLLGSRLPDIPIVGGNDICFKHKTHGK